MPEYFGCLVICERSRAAKTLRCKLKKDVTAEKAVFDSFRLASKYDSTVYFEWAQRPVAVTPQSNPERLVELVEAVTRGIPMDRYPTREELEAKDIQVLPALPPLSRSAEELIALRDQLLAEAKSQRAAQFDQTEFLNQQVDRAQQAAFQYRIKLEQTEQELRKLQQEPPKPTSTPLVPLRFRRAIQID